MSNSPQGGFNSWRGYRLFDVIKKCGQTGNLKLCLDAGDLASFAGGAGQSWLDQSGNGYDFFRGATSGVAADDPTFNGSAGGLSNGEYWSFDGADIFRYDAANEVWMNNLHKDNAVFSFALWLWMGSAGTQHGIFGTIGNSAANTGVVLRKTSGNVLSFVVRNAGGSGATFTMAAGISTSVWSFIGVSVTEATGANGALMMLNTTQELFTSTYTTPAAGNATVTMEIGANGNAVDQLSNTSRIAMFSAWEGRALSADELNAIYLATRGRFGV